MKQMPNPKYVTGIKSTCMACGDKFDFVSASFVPICNDCRKHHEEQKTKEDSGGKKG